MDLYRNGAFYVSRHRSVDVWIVTRVATGQLIGYYGSWQEAMDRIEEMSR